MVNAAELFHHIREWQIVSKRGGSGQNKKSVNQRRFAEGAKEVPCQRFFVGAEHSQYFEVCRTEETTAEQARPHTKHGAMQRIWERANDHAEATERRKREAIQPGDSTETTPWIRRTGWDWYLNGCDRGDLLESIAEPGESDKGEGHDGGESEEEWAGKVDRVAWKIMGELAAISQSTVQ
ncbi:hypothetical protein B0A55_10258 [Friedmanniomyces simplex]|uniref:Uncharacterized protein n=1 Tax=Friedmanniomyces simplex TaxID=329884 RepID=A0A4U0WUW4_9PEZI|nr:hypothetical protein B0A55_11673 [Friedmanniomyces simplex]TKA68532.1 hypothetical protein B0A55_10258 [Friedmanniomyces simplex]